MISLRPIPAISLRVHAEIATVATALLPGERYHLWRTAHQRLIRLACQDYGQYHLATVLLSIAPTALASAASTTQAVPSVPLRLSGVNTTSIMLRSSVESTTASLNLYLGPPLSASNFCPSSSKLAMESLTACT